MTASSSKQVYSAFSHFVKTDIETDLWRYQAHREEKPLREDVYSGQRLETRGSVGATNINRKNLYNRSKMFKIESAISGSD